MGLREKIEENPVVWFLGTLITGFLAGIGAYQGILQIAQLEVVPKTKLESFNADAAALKSASVSARASALKLAQLESENKELSIELEQAKRKSATLSTKSKNKDAISHAPPEEAKSLLGKPWSGTWELLRSDHQKASFELQFQWSDSHLAVTVHNVNAGWNRDLPVALQNGKISFWIEPEMEFILEQSGLRLTGHVLYKGSDYAGLAFVRSA